MTLAGVSISGVANAWSRSKTGSGILTTGIISTSICNIVTSGGGLCQRRNPVRFDWPANAGGVADTSPVPVRGSIIYGQRVAAGFLCPPTVPPNELFGAAAPPETPGDSLFTRQPA